MVNFQRVNISIFTDRLKICTLNLSVNLSSYLNWMRDSSNTFIKSVNPSYSHAELCEYVQSKYESENSLLFGLFDIFTNQHIGNIKFEPIELEERYAIMGIFIGDANYRGTGIAKEAIIHTFEKLFMEYGIEKILLGVSKKNNAAISAYHKCGFIKTDISLLELDKESIEMVLYYSNINKSK